MCGISGLILPGLTGQGDKLASLARRMADTLAHRGPDDSGVYADPDAGVGLGHRRLAILDLSEAGAQPMHSATGRFVLVHNGEIYNFLELRRELEQSDAPLPPWRGDSDTEVMLAAFETWGVEPALTRFTGMFAFALWDRKNRVLHLARDRMGEKPLYYGLTNNGLAFASELKALRALPDFSPELDTGSLALFLRYQYVPEPRSIYKNAFKLRPGHLLTVRADNPTNLNPHPYWSLRAAVHAGLSDPFTGSETEAAEQLETLLGNAVQNQMLSDVPLGSLLSGGIDSSLVTALMQARSDKPVKTFTIGFENQAYDESGDAKKVAEHLRTDHTELTVTPQHVLDLVDRLPDIYDEPFADASQLPTRMVAELTRHHVTVCLTGDGGDETFGGYNRHLWAPAVWNRIAPLPAPLRRLAAGAMHLLTPAAYDALFRTLNPVLPQAARVRTPGNKAHKLADALTANSPENLYKQICSTWPDPAALLPHVTEPETAPDQPETWPRLTDFTRRMQYLDSVTYLPGDVLQKVDRATMHVALESRSPYLDHHVVEFAWRLPKSMLLQQKQGKQILRRILHKYVPQTLVERPKMGFGIPIDQWLRGPLRNWAAHLLDADRLKQQGLVNPEPVQKQLRDHLAGRRDNQYRLWNMLMFQAWYERWM